jgi:hypothetical protein
MYILTYIHMEHTYIWNIHTYTHTKGGMIITARIYIYAYKGRHDHYS